MAVDAPARIAILGAGPIGLEAALYARFLGYEVMLFERGRVAEHLRRFAHVRWFSPFRLNSSPLGISALRAQDPSWECPGEEDILTAGGLVERYFEPLSETDLLAECLHLQTEVLAVGRAGLLKGNLIGQAARAEWPFRLLTRNDQGEHEFEAEIVLDTTGTFRHANHCGTGGIPASGELPAASSIEYRLPDILGAERGRYAGKHTLVLGSGYSAATNMVALRALAREASGTRVTWAVRREAPDAEDFPLRRFPQDPLVERDQLAQTANGLAKGEEEGIRFLAGANVKAIAYDRAADRFEVRFLTDTTDSKLEVDRIIANVGFRPDDRLFSELQVHLCYATGGPYNLAAALLGESSADCLAQPPLGPEVLRNPEPNFYVLGSKSYGRNPHFLVSIGLQQIRDVFAIIGDRSDLDLYATMKAGTA